MDGGAFGIDISPRRMRCGVRAMIVGLAFLLSTLPAQVTGDSITGIWASESIFRPDLLGELTVAREGGRWRASVAGANTRFDVAADGVRFTFAGRTGAFRGRLDADGGAIRGFWLQPSGTTSERPSPVGYRQPFATPLVLRRAGAGVWRGTVRPLEERFTL